MKIINKRLVNILEQTLGKDFITKKVTREWQKKTKYLEDLKDEDLGELKKLKLQQLEGLEYKGKKAEYLYIELQQVTKLTKEDKEFAKFLYEKYPEHSIKKMGL